MIKTIYLAGGCFWGVQHYFDQFDGILKTMVGYANGKTQNPEYKDVKAGLTGHAETLEIQYDDKMISLSKILDLYFDIIDPVSVNQQGEDIGISYRKGIYYVEKTDLETIQSKYNEIQKKYDSPLAVEVEPMKNFFNAEEYQEEKFDKVNTKLTNQQLFNQKAFNFLSPVMYIVMYFLTLAIYFIGAILINNSNLSDKIVLFGDMIVFSSYAMQVIMAFLMLAMIFMMLPRAEVCAKRINEVLDTKSTIKNGTIKKKMPGKEGTVEFKNVSFKYPDADEYILENISFTANTGETVAFIGSTGSGKSTLINLIPRFYDVTEGEVLVDGINVKEYDEEYLNNIIGYVPQKAVMFSGSILSNITYGKSINGKPNKDKVKEAIKISQAEEFVSKLKDKEKSHIAQGGTNVSGGQKQRLSIARTIARNPEIYIFDDSFSALDYKTDATLRNELKKYTKNATSLIVAQRIGTILNADKIIVLDKGKCVGIGTHKELMKKCKVYKEIALSQVTKEELENA